MKDLRAPEKKFRPEIEGVRAVAAFLVAIYHIWLGSVSGGVDVFFIVSGYLITTSLLSKMIREGTIHVAEYLLGLARRLFPVAFTVILFVLVASFFIIPEAQWKQIIAEGYAAVFYFENWQLALNSVDYLAQNNQASPFQHFWALSLQGQFYVTWPLVIFIAYFLANKVFKTPVRKTLLGVLLVIFTISLSYSIYITAVNQPWAYFNTFARVWEFSLGGILALLIPYLKVNRLISLVMGWLGLAIIAFTGAVLPVSNSFPGYVALIPTAGAVFVIISAENSGRLGVDRLLGSKPFLKFGSISYGFYLWHWPLLILSYSYFDTSTVSFSMGIVIIAIALLLAYVSIRFIEAPVRNLNVKTSKWKIANIIILFMIPALATNSSWSAYSDHKASAQQYVVEDYPGARAISEHIEAASGVEPFPSSIRVQEELPMFYNDQECFSFTNDPELKSCSYGDTEDPDYTVALVGGSHSGHWFPALRELSDDLNIQIDVYNKDACRFSTTIFDGLLNESCMAWNEDLLVELKNDPPDLVFTTATVSSGETVPQGYIEQWEKLEGITEIFAVRDNPRMIVDTPICVDEHEDLEECAVPRDQALAEEVPWEHTEGIPDNVTFADMSEFFCDEETCKPVIGNVVVYRDYHHISTIYSKTMAPGLKEHLERAFNKISG